MAAAVAGVHASIATVFALGYIEAESYYPSRVARHHAQLGGGDPFGDTVRALRRHGITTLAYVNTLWAGPHVTEAHPDWMQRRLDGSPTRQGIAAAMCPSSPYVDQLEAITAEIAAGYEIDGFFFDEPSLQSWCACANCREGFQRETGEDLPLRANWKSPAWHRFLEWRFSTVRRFIERLHAAARRSDPGYLVFSQYHFPMATPALEHRRTRWGGAGRVPTEVDDWYRPTYYAEQFDACLENADLAGMEVYPGSVDKPLWWSGAATNLCRMAAERPVLALAQYPQLPWALASLSGVDLRTAVADIVMSGGGPWFAWYGPGAGDERGLEHIAAAFGELARAGDALDGLEPAAEVAIVHSRTTMDRYGLGRVRDRALDEVLGVYKALLEHQVPVAVLSDEHLTPESLARFKVLVLPNTACMTGAARAAVTAFVGRGGGLVSTYESGLYDELGQPARAGVLDRALGVRRSRRTHDIGLGYMRITHPQEVAPGIDERVPVPYRERQIAMVPGQRATVIARAESNVETFGPPRSREGLPPAMAVAYHRQGRSFTFAGNVGLQYYRYRSPEVGAFIAGSVRWAASDPLSLVFAGAPSTVGVNLWHRPSDGALVVMLVNYNTTTSTAAPSLLPVHDVAFTLRWGKGAEDVTARSILDGVDLPTAVVGDMVTVTLPRLDYLAAVAFTRP